MPTRFLFTLEEADGVAIDIYNVAGRRVARRGVQFFPSPGEHTIVWNVGRLPAGIYAVRLVTAEGLTTYGKLAVVP